MNNPDTQATLAIWHRTKTNKTKNTTQKTKKVEDPTKKGGEPRCFLEDNNLDNMVSFYLKGVVGL